MAISPTHSARSPRRVRGARMNYGAEGRSGNAAAFSTFATFSPPGHPHYTPGSRAVSAARCCHISSRPSNLF